MWKCHGLVLVKKNLRSFLAVHPSVILSIRNFNIPNLKLETLFCNVTKDFMICILPFDWHRSAQLTEGDFKLLLSLQPQITSLHLKAYLFTKGYWEWAPRFWMKKYAYSLEQIVCHCLLRSDRDLGITYWVKKGGFELLLTSFLAYWSCTYMIVTNIYFITKFYEYDLSWLVNVLDFCTFPSVHEAQ